MKLNVPHFQQERSRSCGPAALRMIFGYFGDEVAESDLTKSVKLHSFGTYFTELGEVALDRGYRVTCYTCHLSLAGPLKLAFGSPLTLESLKRAVVRPSDRTTAASWKSYLEKDGKLVWQTPRIFQIEEVVRKKLPCLIAINTAAIGNFHRHWDNGHYLVVNGFDEKSGVSVLDPDWPEAKARKTLESDVLLPAWAINATRSAAFLMMVEKAE